MHGDAARPLSRRVRTISDSIGLDKRGADRRDVLHAMRSSCRCRGVASSEFCVVWHQDARSSRRHHLMAITRSEERTSELQSLMRISYAVFCLKKKKNKTY